MKNISTLLALLVILSSSYSVNWNSPINVSTVVNSDQPQVAVDPNGNAVAVWRFQGADIAILGATLPFSATNWSTTEMIFSIAAQSARTPQVGVDAQGNAVAVWDNNTSGDIIQSATKAFSSSTWSSIAQVSTSGKDTTPAIAVDPSGNAVAVWTGFDTVNGIVIFQAAILPFMGSWSSVDSVPFSLPLATNKPMLPSPQVAVDPHGNAVAIWHINFSIIPIDFRIVASTKPFGSPWTPSPAQTISPTPTQNCAFPNISVDSNGNAVAVWQNNTNGRIQAATLIGGVWSAFQNISPSGQVSIAPDIAVAPNGNAVAVWTNSTTNRIQAANLPFSSGIWSSALDISPTTDSSMDSKVAIDSNGNAVAVWTNMSPGFVIQAATFDGSIWASPQTISGINSTGPEIAIDPNGNPVVVWTNTGVLLIQSASGINPFAPPSIQPPSQLTLKQKRNDFAVFSEYFNNLKWQASTSDGLTGYRIFRNSVAIATIGADQLHYNDHDQKKDAPVTYGIASINSQGSLSTIVTISLP